MTHPGSKKLHSEQEMTQGAENDITTEQPGAKNDIGAENDTYREQKMTQSGAKNDIGTQQGAKNDTVGSKKKTLGAINDTREQKMTSEQKMTPGSKK